MNRDIIIACSAAAGGKTFALLLNEMTKIHPDIGDLAFRLTMDYLNQTERRKRKVTKFKFKYTHSKPCPGGGWKYSLKIKYRDKVGEKDTSTISVLVDAPVMYGRFTVSTVSRVAGQDDHIVVSEATGLSRCSGQDEPSVKKGEAIALSRAMKALSMKILGIPISGNDPLMG